MADNKNAHLVPVKEQDLLDQDPQIRGQTYACLSFISPESVIRSKEVYFFNRFLSMLSKDLSDCLESIKLKFSDNQEIVDMMNNVKERYDYAFDAESLEKEYTYYKSTNAQLLEKEYLEKNNYQTSIRGIKVRGVYETIGEAQARAHQLRRMDKYFDVYVAEVGCWCPFHPNPGEVQDQEYMETELNTLMKKYKENQDGVNVHYEERKKYMVEQNVKASEARKPFEIVEEEEEEEEDKPAPEAKDEEAGDSSVMSAEDPWLQRQKATN